MLKQRTERLTDPVCAATSGSSRLQPRRQAARRQASQVVVIARYAGHGRHAPGIDEALEHSMRIEIREPEPEWRWVAIDPPMRDTGAGPGEDDIPL